MNLFQKLSNGTRNFWKDTIAMLPAGLSPEAQNALEHATPLLFVTFSPVEFRAVLSWPGGKALKSPRTGAVDTDYLLSVSEFVTACLRRSERKRLRRRSRRSIQAQRRYYAF